MYRTCWLGQSLMVQGSYPSAHRKFVVEQEINPPPKWQDFFLFFKLRAQAKCQAPWLLLRGKEGTLYWLHIGVLRAERKPGAVTQGWTQVTLQISSCKALGPLNLPTRTQSCCMEQRGAYCQWCAPKCGIGAFPAPDYQSWKYGNSNLSFSTFLGKGVETSSKAAPDSPNHSFGIRGSRGRVCPAQIGSCGAVWNPSHTPKALQAGQCHSLQSNTKQPECSWLLSLQCICSH